MSYSLIFSLPSLFFQWLDPLPRVPVYLIHLIHLPLLVSLLKHLVEIQRLQPVVLAHAHISLVRLIDLASLCLNQLPRHRISLVFLRLLDVSDLFLQRLYDLLVLGYYVRLRSVMKNVTLTHMLMIVLLSLGERRRGARFEQSWIVDQLVVLVVDMRMA